VAADARLLEPEWVKVRRIKLGTSKPSHRIVQFTDIHHKGDRAYLVSVVKQINALSPDFVCFTGDLIEEGKRAVRSGHVSNCIRATLRQPGLGWYPVPLRFNCRPEITVFEL